MSPRTVLALLAFLAFISLGLPDGLLGVSWPSIRATFERPLDAMGWLVAFTTAGYLTSSFLSGALLRVMPIGLVLALSTLAAASALIGYAATPSWWLMVALSFIGGLGGGAIDAGLNAYGATHFSARTLNWLHAFFGLGTTIGPLIVTAVLDAELSWRWSYVIAGSVQLALGIVFFATRARWMQLPNLGEDAPLPVKAASTVATLRRPGVWLGMAVFFVYAGLELATAQWIFTLLHFARGFDEATAGLLVSLYWGSLMVGRVLFGLVAERVKLAATLRLCILLAVVGALLVWLVPAGGLQIVGLMMIGFFLAPVFASLISLTPARVGAAHADSTIGFQIAAAGLGGATLTALTGLLTPRFGIEVIGPAIAAYAVTLLVLYEVLMRVSDRPAERA